MISSFLHILCVTPVLVAWIHEPRTVALATKNLSLQSQGFRLPRLDGNNRAASEASTGPQWMVGFGKEMAKHPVSIPSCSCVRFSLGF
jgi:hypothetical protein